MSVVRFALAGVWLGIAAAFPAFGDSGADPEWEVFVTPYGWATWLEGDVSARGASAEVSATFSDILSQLNVGAMGAVEVRRDRFLLLFDGVWAQLSDDFERGPRDVSIGPASAMKGPVLFSIPQLDLAVGPLEVDTEIEELILDLKLGYTVFSKPDEGLFVDLLAGVRYWYLKAEIDVELPPIEVPPFTVTTSVPGAAGRLPDFLVGRLALPDISVPGVTTAGLDRSFEDSVDWFDPLVGVRVRMNLTDDLTLALLGDVGGFGIGSASEFTWNAIAAFGWPISEGWTLRVGYKALGIDRENGDVEAKITIHGPVIGATYRF